MKDLFLAWNNVFRGKNAQFGTGKWLEQIKIFLMEISGISPKEIQ